VTGGTRHLLVASPQREGRVAVVVESTRRHEGVVAMTRVAPPAIRPGVELGSVHRLVAIRAT
jgi:hypothetical protein